MAIGFARVEFVKRSSGKNACAKAAYNSRSKIELESNQIANSKTYDWSSKEMPAYHEVLLPAHVNLKFKNPSILWNSAEAKEVKSNAQVAMEAVLALPDDRAISLNDKIALAHSFVQKCFVDKGLAAQIDIHAPEPFLIITGDNTELGLKKGMKGDIISQTKDQITIELDSKDTVSFNPAEFTGFIIKEHNWHAHVLVTTRRFKENGLELNDLKARDLMPQIIKGRVVSGSDWGKLWAEHQNTYFHEKGFELRVDTYGLVPQEHLGPYRMRARAFSLFEEHHRILEENRQAFTDPGQMLEAVTSQHSVFTKENIDNLIAKHVPSTAVDDFVKAFWEHPSIVQLADKETGQLLSKFTSQAVLLEEQQLLRLSDRIHMNAAIPVQEKAIDRSTEKLNQEQRNAFQAIVRGHKLSLVQGYAGTGKSHLLKALQTTYEGSGYRVRALGPDNATTHVLREKGLSHTENVYRFLFGLHNNRRTILKGKEVWILDEAGKLGNRPLLEFLREAEKRGVQLILSGDTAQLPPVDRGGMFKVLCEKYGSSVLEEIQRQQIDKHREIATHLATGEFGAAIDKLCGAQGIRWAEKKSEAMEELILRWARDTRAFPNTSTIIMAHSNTEVRVMNEMVRLIRKQRGELGEKEFECTTHQGKIYVSPGDRIEFRKNDKELGLTNGLSGVIVDAMPDQFVVAIREGEQQQTVTFNPQQYHAFQLGYATTFFRSQGRTVDRGYVLHSRMMNKEMFYVGLTRHVKDVLYFVSRDEVYCLADLKRMALKSSLKSLTVDFTTSQEISTQKAEQARAQEIDALKQSDSIVARWKGYGLETWDRIIEKTSDLKDRVSDRIPDASFYCPAISEQPHMTVPVIEVPQPMIQEEPRTGDSAVSLGSDQEQFFRRFIHRLLESVPSTHHRYVINYQNAVDKAATLKWIVDVESEDSTTNLKSLPHFQEWQQACGVRNQAAYELLGQLTPQSLKVDKKMVQIIQEQAQRHELFLSKRDVHNYNLEDDLKNHLEPLLYRFYPEGPTSRDRLNFRFGSKGSLSVVHSGKKAGQFFDFENHQGGGLLKLIQRELGLGKVEAKIWAKEFLGIASDITVPTTFLYTRHPTKGGDEWVSLPSDPSHPAPSLTELKGSRLDTYFDEVCRHAYHDVNGQLLYYVLRLKDKNDLTKKITPPLSYGYWKSEPDQREWRLKGFQEEKRSLYRLPHLKDYPEATILIVEGEKTADQALNNFPNEPYICISWPGGAGAVHKADWMPLQGRKVIVWPDNDRAGFEAGEKVCFELRKVGAKSIRIIDAADLEKLFPQKWDLADPLPENVSKDVLRSLIISAQEKAIDPTQLISRLGLPSDDRLIQARVNEILWRVDKRLRTHLEQENGGQFVKTKEMILQETCRIFSEHDKRKSELATKHGMGGEFLNHMSYQVTLFEAERGRAPNMHELQSMRESIQQHGAPHISHQKSQRSGIEPFKVKTPKDLDLAGGNKNKHAELSID